MKTAIAYYRVSTERQGVSGLGLEAQRATVEAFAASRGYELAAEHTEVESGKRSDRPRLAEALADAKRRHATLLIAKIDRLARNVHFVSGLMESGVDFCACDLPEASPLVLHIMAAVGEAEAKAISERTKAALGAARTRGTLLGASNPRCRNLTASAASLGGKTSGSRKAAKAREAYEPLVPFMRKLQEHGASYATIAKALNREGHRTATGCEWNAMQAYRVLNRVT